MDMILSSPARGHVIIHQARASDRNFMRLPCIFDPQFAWDEPKVESSDKEKATLGLVRQGLGFAAVDDVRGAGDEAARGRGEQEHEHACKESPDHEGDHARLDSAREPRVRKLPECPPVVATVRAEADAAGMAVRAPAPQDPPFREIDDHFRPRAGWSMRS
jgi:hypothetical protein